MWSQIWQNPQTAAAAKSFQLCPTLCDPINGSPPGSSVPGILQARILEWVAFSFSNACMPAKSLQSCPTLCNPMDSSPPGSSIQGILQARTLEWIAISFSKPAKLVPSFPPWLCFRIIWEFKNPNIQTAPPQTLVWWGQRIKFFKTLEVILKRSQSWEPLAKVLKISHYLI